LDGVKKLWCHNVDTNLSCQIPALANRDAKELKNKATFETTITLNKLPIMKYET
jgi:hypothetical protein